MSLRNQFDVVSPADGDAQSTPHLRLLAWLVLLFQQGGWLDRGVFVLAVLCGIVLWLPLFAVALPFLLAAPLWRRLVRRFKR